MQFPPFVEYASRSFSFGPGLVSVGVGPSVQVTTTSLVAPAPVGAPLAMSAVGNVPSRLPATPSKTVSPLTGSVRPDGTNGEMIWGRVNVWPPSNERAWKMTGCLFWLPSQNTNSVPVLVVRIQQSCRPLFTRLLTAALTCFSVQVEPPSVDRATLIGSGSALPLRSWLRNAA